MWRITPLSARTAVLGGELCVRYSSLSPLLDTRKTGYTFSTWLQFSSAPRQTGTSGGELKHWKLWTYGVAVLIVRVERKQWPDDCWSSLRTFYTGSIEQQGGKRWEYSYQRRGDDMFWFDIFNQPSVDIRNQVCCWKPGRSPASRPSSADDTSKYACLPGNHLRQLVWMWCMHYLLLFIGEGQQFQRSSRRLILPINTPGFAFWYYSKAGDRSASHEDAADVEVVDARRKAEKMRSANTACIIFFDFPATK